jgi:hypothetical protein
MTKRAAVSLALAVVVLWSVSHFFLRPLPSHAQSKVELPATTPQRWQIYRAELSVSAEGKEPARGATNTILLDTATGETWILWPSKDGEVGYSWLKLPRKRE